MTGRSTDLDPAVRAGLEESIRRLRATCEAELEHDVTTELGAGAVVTHRKVPIDRVGLYVPGGLAPLVSSVVMNVVPAQVAGRALDRAGQPAAEEHATACPSPRSWPPARCSASTRSTPSAAPRRSPCSPTAPARAGRSTSSPARATSTSPPPSGCSAAWSASTPRPGPPRSRSWPTTRADAAYVAADLISQAEHDPLAASVLVTDSRALADDGRGRARQAGLRDPPHRAASAPRWAGRSRASCWSTTSTRASTSSTRTPPSTSRSSTRDAAAARRPGPQRRRRLRRPLRAGVAGRLLRRLQPRAADRRLRLPLQRAVACAPS